MNDGPYDFFVSYARSDNANGWVTGFVEALLTEHHKFSPDRSLKPFFDQKDIKPGADWEHTLHHGIAGSRLFLAFISPNYFASEWCCREWRAWIDAEISKHILTKGIRPVYLVEVPGFEGRSALSEQEVACKVAQLCGLRPPPSGFVEMAAPVLKQVRRRQLLKDFAQPFHNEGLDALRRDDLRRALNELASDLDHHAELLRLADGSFTTVPPYNKNFTGRLDDLLELRKRLKDDQVGVVCGVQGLGGIGKTELAFTYAHAFASSYPGGRFLIRCEGKSDLREAILGQSDFTALFRDRISDEERKLSDTFFAAVLACLRERLDHLGHILLVLDNVTDSAQLTPRQTDLLTTLGPMLHLLATTRLPAPTSGHGRWISLGQLPDQEALDLVEKHRLFDNEADRNAAQRLVKRLGGFMLAIELIAAYLREHPGVSYAQMADNIGLEDLEHPSVLASGQELRYDHDRRLSAALGSTLSALSPAEQRALEYASLLPPDQVPLPWLRALVIGDFPEMDRSTRLSNPWEDLWRRLEKLALFSRPEQESTEPRLMRIHRLVQQVVQRDLLEPNWSERQASVDRLVQERVAALEKVTRWEDTRWEIEALDALAWLWAQDVPDTSISDSSSPPQGGQEVSATHPLASWLLDQVGTSRYNLAQWTQAEPLLRRALAIDERSFGPNHPRMATDLNNLATLLQATNRLEEAEPLLRRALAIDEQSFSPNHPRMATDLNNLAQLLKATSRLDEAEPLLRRALAISEQSFGPAHPNVAIRLNNLATLLQTINRLGEAEPLLRRALAIDEQSFGPHHPNVARELNNLAAMLYTTNRLREAEPLLRRALAISEQSFGPAHPDVAIRLNNLAQLLQATNRLGEAEPLLRRALAIDEKYPSGEWAVAGSRGDRLP